MIHDASGKLTGLKLKSGKELPADTVIAGIGAKCNLDLFEDKLETTQGGLKVDGRSVSAGNGVMVMMPMSECFSVKRKCLQLKTSFIAAMLHP